MLQSSNIVRELNGVKTDVLLQAFADRVLILVTQLGKVGNLIQATMPSTMPLLPPPPPDSSHPNVVSLPAPHPSLQLTPLLASAPTEHLRTLQSLYASQIATLVWTTEEMNILEADRRPVVVGIALAKSPSEQTTTATPDVHERAVFYGVMEMVQELLAKT